MEQPILNIHNKQEYPPAHTAEHLLNRTMQLLYGCPRSRNAHIERKKSKISWMLPTCPTEAEVADIERRINDLIGQCLPVECEYVSAAEASARGVALDRLPEDVSATIRLVRIGTYDVCPCIGNHVNHTGEIGEFVLLGTNWDEGTKNFRIRFKVIAPREEASSAQ